MKITHEEDVHDRLFITIGRGGINHFVSCILPYASSQSLELGYCMMAVDQEREREPGEWLGTLAKDGARRMVLPHFTPGERSGMDMYKGTGSRRAD